MRISAREACVKPHFHTRSEIIVLFSRACIYDVYVYFYIPWIIVSIFRCKFFFKTRDEKILYFEFWFYIFILNLNFEFPILIFEFYIWKKE